MSDPNLLELLEAEGKAVDECALAEQEVEIGEFCEKRMARLLNEERLDAATELFDAMREFAADHPDLRAYLGRFAGCCVTLIDEFVAENCLDDAMKLISDLNLLTMLYPDSISAQRYLADGQLCVAYGLRDQKNDNALDWFLLATLSCSRIDEDQYTADFSNGLYMLVARLVNEQRYEFVREGLERMFEVATCCPAMRTQVARAICLLIDACLSGKLTDPDFGDWARRLLLKCPFQPELHANLLAIDARDLRDAVDVRDIEKAQLLWDRLLTDVRRAPESGGLRRPFGEGATEVVRLTSVDWMDDLLDVAMHIKFEDEPLIDALVRAAREHPVEIRSFCEAHPRRDMLLAACNKD